MLGHDLAATAPHIHSSAAQPPRPSCQGRLDRLTLLRLAGPPPRGPLGLQLDALTHAGCERIFQDEGISGAATDRRALNDALAALAPGDVEARSAWTAALHI